MSFLSTPVLVLIFLALTVFFVLPYLKKPLQWSIAGFINLPDDYMKQILPSLARVVKLNWYTFLMIFLLWFLLSKTGIGKDIIETYLNRLSDGATGFRFGSYLSLFGTVLCISLSIWVLPFFLYSWGRTKEILKNAQRFYIATKLLAFIAMLPFMVVTNAFAMYNPAFEANSRLLIIINLFLFLLFLGFIWLTTTASVTRVIHRLNAIPWKFENPYMLVIARLAIIVLLLAMLFSFITNKNSNPLYFVAIFLFISSIAVFRLLFYSDENGPNVHKNTYDLVRTMLSTKNRKHSRLLYLLLLSGLGTIFLVYYFLHDLTVISTLYILLIVFSFYIIYLDFWRNAYRNFNKLWKVIAFGATILFLVTPFLGSEKQFRIQLDSSNKTLAVNQTTLESALQQRYNYILKTNTDTMGNIDSTVFIVCAMGGGSRAGYIAAATLLELDKRGVKLWERTLCYSTISGGSVGTYNYLKAKQLGLQNTDDFLREVYKQNYNSSGAFGLLAGDPLESLLRSIVTVPRSWNKNNITSYGFHDRNQRIRLEYDMVLREALLQYNTADGNFNHDSAVKHTNDFFKAYFQQNASAIPIHLVNTFEVNSGRRTVLSPFFVKGDSSFFLNAILPLQDTSYDCQILNKDIRYREAVNLSELFPLISAASHIGGKSNAQFVDGGYFENYGLATGLDVFYYLKSLGIDPRHIKILLIKNSRQQPATGERNIQVLAPVTGAMNSPFTGHANQFLMEAKRIAGDSNVYIVEFDAEKYKVPLTRSLNKRHIDSMQKFIDTFRVQGSGKLLGL